MEETEAMSERWLPVPNAPEYEVSDLGRLRKDDVLRPTLPDPRGYPRTSIRGRQRRMHTVIALAFLGPKPAGQEVRHLDDDKGNNRLSNLAYGTRSDNLHDAVRNGRHVMAERTHCPQGHPYIDENTYRHKNQDHQRRRCRICVAEQNAASKRRRAA